MEYSQVLYLGNDIFVRLEYSKLVGRYLLRICSVFHSVRILLGKPSRQYLKSLKFEFL